MGTLTLVTMTSVAMSDEYQEKTFKGFFFKVLQKPSG